MLKTPHLQGLLQQLRISTPSLGAQVPPMLKLWLQGIHRHHRQPQPGLQIPPLQKAPITLCALR